MRINKITIKNFRSIKDAVIIPSNFNVFVGQNNHGKTNLFEALDWFFGPSGDIDKIRFGQTGTNEVVVEVEFGGAQEGAAKMKHAAKKTTIEALLGSSDVITIKRTSLDVKNRKILDPKTGIWLAKNPTGIDPALNDFLPMFEYVNTQINPLDVAKYGKKTPIADMLSGVLTAILETNQEYKDFREQFDKLFTAEESEVRVKLNGLSGEVQIYLEKQFPDCTKVVFEVTPPLFDDLLKNFETSIDDGVYTTASEKGDGMQRALMLAIIQTYADFRRVNEETSKFFLFFIDEGELHLHPTAQRKLKNALLDLAEKGDQVFLNTHSSVLVSDDTAGQTIFKVEKVAGITYIAPIAAEEKRYIVYDLLGGSPTDLLLPPNFLIVEGKSEYEFLSRVINRFYPDKPPIQILYAEGDEERESETMDSINKAFVPLFSSSIYEDRLVILCDTPNSKQKNDFDEFKKVYPKLEKQGQLFLNPETHLEEYYPNTWKKTLKEVIAMKKVLNAKILLARQAGDGITKEQFESEMEAMLQALEAAWDKAY